ncbi:MAG TPA: glycosyltransferase family 4 protein [bacterium]|nr:glycosyltransferase family 4 protein [bacterium]HNZ51397.1 glycosyltransferase family 4 protein [bacterium]HOF79833.1 glycosyltransferase family 4 protein [bacterium]HOH85439.1 glycosyltransferase family 4 protein [bacterium]HOQ91744.1 glycosyltransferase family 4 protein [bacterium]
MRIVHLVCTFPPYRGGMGSSVQQMVGELVASNQAYQVAVVCPDYGQCQNNTNQQWAGYQIIRLASWLSVGNAAILKGLSQIWRSADIVHLHYPFYGTDGLVWWLKKKYPKTKLIIHYHMDPQAGGWRGWFFKFFRKLFLARLLKQAEAITCASLDYWQSSAAGRLKLKLADKLLAVPFRVDTERFQPRPKDQQLVDKLSLNNQRPTILMVGGLDKAHYFKGVDVFLKSLASLKQVNSKLDFQAVIVGDGDLKKGYQAMAERLGLADRVRFTGAVSSQQLPAMYNLADLFVLPSINRCEAFGIVLLEAMASGLPCLAANLPGVRQVIAPGVNGQLIKPADWIDLAEKIASLLSDQSQLRAMAIASRQRAEQNFSLGRPSELNDIYQRLVAL